jgi:hypothetical protein
MAGAAPAVPFLFLEQPFQQFERVPFRVFRRWAGRPGPEPAGSSVSKMFSLRMTISLKTALLAARASSEGTVSAKPSGRRGETCFVPGAVPVVP